MIRSAVASASLPQTPLPFSLEEFLSPEWLCRPRPEPIEREFRLLARFDVHEDVIIFLLGRRALPVKIEWIVGGHLDARATRQDRLLFGTPAAQHETLPTVYFVDFRGLDATIQDDHFHVFGIRRH